MKTVMKKMFSLLLVAVMLVSVMPFAAFAESEGETETCEHDRGDAYACRAAECIKCGAAMEASASHDYADANCTTPKKCKVCGSETGPKNEENHDWADATCRADKTCKRCGATVADTKLPHDRAQANCTTPSKCKVCGSETGSALGHDWDDATCTAPKTCDVCGETEGTALGHQLGSDKVCTVCHECDHCKEEISEAADHLDSCPNSPKYKSECEKCGEEYVTVEGHDDDDCKVCWVCYEKGDTVKTHKTADHCAECGNTDGTHKNTCSKAPQTGNATVKVHVRLYTSNVHTKTVELLTYKDSSDARIYSSVAKHDDLIRAELAEQYPGYSWSGNLYDNPGETEDTKETIGKGTTVYINAYTDQDLIYIYVHNSRSMSNLRIVQLEGKQVGETVTKSEVSKAVKKYFNVNSLSMYSEQAWEDYVDGESVESVSSLKVTSDPYFIDVKISGSAKSTSGSGSTADSTNPKTGDAIFAPAMILGLSASALVVLYYLNKKRAF